MSELELARARAKAKLRLRRQSTSSEPSVQVSSGMAPLKATVRGLVRAPVEGILGTAKLASTAAKAGIEAGAERLAAPFTETPAPREGFVSKFQKEQERYPYASTLEDVEANIRALGRPTDVIAKGRPAVLVEESKQAESFDKALREATQVGKGGIDVQNIAELSVALPSLYGLAKGLGKIGIRAAGKLGAVKKGTEKAMRFSGRRIRVGEPAVEEIIKQPERINIAMKEGSPSILKNVRDNIVDELGEYVTHRNKSFVEAMKPIMKEKGNAPVNVMQARRAIMDALGEADSLPAGFVKFLRDKSVSLANKGEMSARNAVRLKQLINKKYGGFNKKFGFGQTAEQSVHARKISRAFKESIDSALPETTKINKEYADASDLISNLNEVVLGSPTKAALGGKRLYKSAIGNLKKVMKEDPEVVQDVIEEFAKRQPGAQNVINDLKIFLASRELNKVHQGAIRALGSPQGVMMYMGDLIDLVMSQPIRRGASALSIMQQPQRLGGAGKLGAAIVGGPAQEGVSNLLRGDR